MQRFLNTLYVTTQKTYLHKKGEAIEVIVDDKVKASIPMINLDSIVCFGNIYVSPFLLGAAPEKNITISFLSETGTFLARVQGPVAGNVLLRKVQYRVSDDKDKSASVARYFITGKIANQKTVLQRAVRDHGVKLDVRKVQSVIDSLSRNLDKLGRESDLDKLRGIEGDSAESYFSVFDELITSQKDGFKFAGRNRRPPLDNVNAMLSYVYTLLYHDMISSLECSGLDPAVGFMHRDRPGRLSLALDLMEEFRSFFADRLVLSLINRGEISASQFEKTASGAVIMNEEARKTVIGAYQKKKETVLNHPYVEKKMHLAILFHTQARLLARFLRGDIDGYPVYIWK
ncbi:MAG: type I-C CRISPR-associated endonuclease Cas1c [Treponema sp.]|nr:type I-C CRISPR-associated endonuclease Cas1c [Treponema sp.]